MKIIASDYVVVHQLPSKWDYMIPFKWPSTLFFSQYLSMIGLYYWMRDLWRCCVKYNLTIIYSCAVLPHIIDHSGVRLINSPVYTISRSVIYLRALSARLITLREPKTADNSWKDGRYFKIIGNLFKWHLAAARSSYECGDIHVCVMLNTESD